MLTTVLNDSPVFPESEEEADLTAPLLMDSPQVRIITGAVKLIRINILSIRNGYSHDFLNYVVR